MGAAAESQTLRSGDRAPDFSLTGLDGTVRSLSEMLREGPVLLAFFKISCPTCQLTFPYLARLSETETRFVGISQDDAPSTRAFISRFAVGFDVVLDPATERYPVSNAYGITHVPTFFLIEPGGRIAAAWTGFSRAEMESLAARLRRPLFTAADQVPAWKAG